ncbi:MAG: hypothetical protein DRN35_00305 [Thermoplasmata archaeon]|nr:MAG: hypothetical protein DRN28_00975 [Thermoplasmata archaeon]RLF72087.1 MAG: hypothetical protein DRN40_01060 [Thermoplasmata archaeon]RLF72578.1 MAG: hypothetical protein DRN35_00305 [Thermoplasmata archaeon]RLF74051.1 MAG: hypothetical protein DRN55_01520 [Thermoplasmata archaeon]
MMKPEMKKALAAGAVVVLLLSIAVYYVTRPAPPAPPKYSPTLDLPEDYIIVAEQPDSMEDMLAIATISSLAVKDGCHPFFIATEEGLDNHQLDTLEKLSCMNLPVILFANNETLAETLKGQGLDLRDEFVLPLCPKAPSLFKGFEGLLYVESFRDALWSAPVAAVEGKVMYPYQATFSSQEEAWAALKARGVPFEYLVVANPYDLNAKTLEENTPSYNEYDSLFHIDALSALAPTVAAYHRAYVLTDWTPSTEEIGYLDTELNSRAIGLYLKLKEVSGTFGVPHYIALFGSAAAVPQFQLPDTTSSDPNSREGDSLVNSDVVYGFLDEDPYTMDASVGRFINLNLQGLSNQITRTFLYERFSPTIVAEYSTGHKTVEWRRHGTSLSGFQITYQRRQATPARFFCRDLDDEGMTYDYYGPSGVGHNLLPDPVEPTTETDITKSLQASGFVAYRGHGSETGSLYMISYVTTSDPDGVLRSEEARELLLPPQVAFFVACMNAKIHGKGFGSHKEDLNISRAFALNYLYGGAVAVGGATEVSYSNVGQDSDALVGEATGNHQWDLNDAWYAFFWDGVLNHEEEYGSVGDALRWAENRYINNPNHDFRLTPLEQNPDDPNWESLYSAHWKEISMFVIYGDPAFRPYISSPGPNDYDPWHNGDQDY